MKASERIEKAHDLLAGQYADKDFILKVEDIYEKENEYFFEVALKGASTFVPDLKKVLNTASAFDLDIYLRSGYWYEDECSRFRFWAEKEKEA